MALRWDPKDPDETLDYTVDWSARLGEDTIDTSAFTVTAGDVEIEAQSNTDTVGEVWLSGGTLGQTCKLLNRITTADGRTMDQTVLLRIASK